MERQIFKTKIDVPREKVWEMLWGDKTYSEWTIPFAEGSKAETDWKEGSKILFLNGKGQGMVSIIEKKDPPEFMSFKHIGFVQDGKEITQGEDVEKWAPAYENYTLKAGEQSQTTELVVEMDIEEDYKEYFDETWPKALEKLKAMCMQ